MVSKILASLIIRIESTETEYYLGFETADEIYGRLVRFKKYLHDQEDLNSKDNAAS